MDITSAGSLALLTYQSNLLSGSPAQALQQAFQSAATSGSRVASLLGTTSDAATLSLSTQPPSNLATYQFAAQAGFGAASIQSLIATAPSPDALLAAGMNSGSQGFPVVDPTVAAAWSSFQYALSMNSGQASAYTQQLAATATLASGGVNLLA